MSEEEKNKMAKQYAVLAEAQYGVGYNKAVEDMMELKKVLYANRVWSVDAGRYYVPLWLINREMNKLVGKENTLDVPPLGTQTIEL